MALDLSTAEANLDAWIAADLLLSQGRTVTMDGRTITKTDANLVREQIEFWESKVAQIKAQAVAGTDDYARHQPGVRVARWTR